MRLLWQQCWLLNLYQGTVEAGKIFERKKAMMHELKRLRENSF